MVECGMKEAHAKNTMTRMYNLIRFASNHLTTSTYIIQRQVNDMSILEIM